jgi:hypothetical protein
MFYVHGIFSTNEMKIKEIEAYCRFCMHFWQACKEICNRCQEIRWVGAMFSKFPEHYPDPENPGQCHYMNVFKTPTTLNDGQQQPVDNFAPRANLKCVFLKTVLFHLAIVRWKKQQVGISRSVEGKHVPECIRHLEELKIVSMIRENSGLSSFHSDFFGGGHWKF